MNAYTFFCSNVLFPLHELLKHHDTVAVKRQLERSQWLTTEQIRELQLQRLRAFLSECGMQVPYYRDLFRSLNFDPAAITSLDDLACLPLLTKDIIRSQFDRLRSDLPEPVKLFSTTGSTGDPLRFNISNTRISHDVAAKWRATRWWDVDIGDREMVIWSSPIELTKQDRVKQVRDWLLRSKLVSSAAMSPADMDRYIAEIRAFRPAMLFGYPSSMTLLAQRAEQQGVRLDDLGIKVAFCTAERMYPHQADVLQRVFGCPVANGYGGRDSGFILAPAHGAVCRLLRSINIPPAGAGPRCPGVGGGMLQIPCRMLILPGSWLMPAWRNYSLMLGRWCARNGWRRIVRLLDEEEKDEYLHKYCG